MNMLLDLANYGKAEEFVSNQCLPAVVSAVLRGFDTTLSQSEDLDPPRDLTSLPDKQAGLKGIWITGSALEEIQRRFQVSV